MSTNYNILLESEKKLKELIIEYIHLVHEIHFKLWRDIEKDKDELRSVLDNVERRLQKSKVLEEELLDECIWTISKDDPRANHLRFIISIIYATKDLSRACEYAKAIAKLIVRKSFKVEWIKYLKPVSKLYLDQIESLLKIYQSNIDDKFEKIEELNVSYETSLEKIYVSNKKQLSDEIAFFRINQVSRLMASTIERIQSIFSSTVFVKQKSYGATKTIKINSKK